MIHRADKDTVTYSVVPERIPEKEIIKDLKDLKALNMQTNGYSGDKSLRYIGNIDYGLYYNFAVANGVKNSEIHEWYSRDKGKNIKALMNKYSHCKIVDKL